ncbi:hypothetical protein ABK040_006374 [Willaertia magna]
MESPYSRSASYTPNSIGSNANMSSNNMMNTSGTFPPVEPPHLLSIKLMRLKKPEFSLDVPILTERRDALGNDKIFCKTPNFVSDIKHLYGENSKDVNNNPVLYSSTQDLLDMSTNTTTSLKEEQLLEIPSTDDLLKPSLSSGSLSGNNTNNTTYITDKNIIIDGLGLTNTWTLPSAPGAIYVGETLKCYISLHNESFQTLKNISITAELYTGKGKTTKQVLLDLASTPIDQLQSKCNKDFIIEQPLSTSDDPNDEDDKTYLVCNVLYYDPEEGRMRSFRKLFPFKVYNPLGMKVKVYTLASHIFVQLDLQNLTHSPSLFVDQIKFDPNYGFDLIDHSTHNSSVNFADHPMMRGETRRLLFELVPNLKNSKTINTLGKISLQWKNTLGECGMLVTNAIQHKGITKQELEAYIVGFNDKLPVDHFNDLLQTQNDAKQYVNPNANFSLHQPFYAICEIINYGKEKMNLSLQLEPERLYPIGVLGSSIQIIGEVEPLKPKIVFIHLFPLKSGIHSLIGKGILVKDTISSKTYTLLPKSVFIN